MTIPTLDRNFDLPPCLSDLGTVYGKHVMKCDAYTVRCVCSIVRIALCAVTENMSMGMDVYANIGKIKTCACA